ncbi:MAG TPA: PQQ-binding-like beta-propeller repeat protein [Gemmataceae bacterium]|nr:PQQ-binding-like beta-propeller repeat protein [Gemmataceae bacterium]
MANPEKLKLVKDIPHKAITFAIARVPDSARVFLGCSDFKVYEADITAAKFEPKELYAHESYVTGVALAGKTLVSGSYDQKLTWFDTESNKTVRSHEAHAKWIRRVVASREGKTIASIADDMVCRVWNAADGKLIHELRGHGEKTPHGFGSMLYAAAFSADGKHLATGDKVGKIRVWDVATGKALAEMEAPVMYTWDPVQRLHSIGGIRSLAFSPDGKTLAVGGTGKIGNIDHLEAKARIELFDWRASKRLAEYASDKYQGLVNHLEYAPDGSWLLGAGGANEGFIVFLDADAKKTLRGEKVGMHVHDVASSEYAETLIAAGHNKLAVYEMKS